MMKARASGSARRRWAPKLWSGAAPVTPVVCEGAAEAVGTTVGGG
jgi:hypothetical protein